MTRSQRSVRASTSSMRRALPYETMLSTVRIRRSRHGWPIPSPRTSSVRRRRQKSRYLLETTSPIDRLAARWRAVARGRDREAARGQEDPAPRQEPDGEGAEGVLPQREDEGDPERAGPQGRVASTKNTTRSAQKIEEAEDAGRGQGKGPMAGAEASRGDARRSRPRRPSPGTTSSGWSACRGRKRSRENREIHRAEEDPRRGPLRP